MRRRFQDPRAPVPPGRRPGKLLPFRVPVGGILTHPGWRWAAAGGVIFVGSLVGIFSLAPHWLFQRAGARGDAPAPAPHPVPTEPTRLRAAGPVLDFDAVPGATLYRVRVLDDARILPVYETESPEPNIELPPEAAAALAPGGRGHLTVDAVGEQGEALDQQTVPFTLEEGDGYRSPGPRRSGDG